MSLTAIIFVAGYVSGLLAGLLRNPVYALYTYIAVFYLHPKHRWWGVDLPEMRWSLIAAVVTIVAAARLSNNPERDSWASSGCIKITLMFVSWFWIQSLWAPGSGGPSCRRYFANEVHHPFLRDVQAD